MKASLSTIIVTATLTFTTTGSKAQFFKDVSVGANVGAYIYQGDLAPSAIGSLKTASPGFSLFAQKTFNKYLSFRLNFSASTLKGDESKYNTPVYRQYRNFMFSSPLHELSGLIVWNIKGSNYTNYGITPYLFTGLGFSLLNTHADFSRLNTTYFKDDTTILARAIADREHGTPKIIPVIPIGAGIEVPVSNRLSVHTEAAYRYTFTDYIDGFSMAAGPKMKDSYYSVSVGVRYQLFDNGNKSNRLGCPANLY